MSGPLPIPNSHSVHPLSELKCLLLMFTDPVPVKTLMVNEVHMHLTIYIMLHPYVNYFKPF